ncbi:hypothetical protein RND71_018313 [Anisodus tanguticus]|uniref:Uncharacterized protein n=1 Tax=Anisodus tanguticus TaxID=243964 RepID=A0AAE1S4J7_9SOLA|nr:hypothetical protein RND71_018313 [Anisodus tanguticus]
MNLDHGTVGIEKKNEDVNIDKVGSPPLSARLGEITKNLRLLEASTPLHILMPKQSDASQGSLESCDIVEPKTPKTETDVRNLEIVKYTSPWERFHTRSSGVKERVNKNPGKLAFQYYSLSSLSLHIMVYKSIPYFTQGIGEKRATYILELREESPEPFKRVNGLMRRMAGQLFN